MSVKTRFIDHTLKKKWVNKKPKLVFPFVHYIKPFWIYSLTIWHWFYTNPTLLWHNKYENNNMHQIKLGFEQQTFWLLINLYHYSVKTSDHFCVEYAYKYTRTLWLQVNLPNLTNNHFWFSEKPWNQIWFFKTPFGFSINHHQCRKPLKIYMVL